MQYQTPSTLEALDRLARQVQTLVELVEKHLPGQHDQADHGRGGGRTAQQEKEPPVHTATLSDPEASALSFQTIEKEGFTYDPVHKLSPTEGYSVAKYKSRELIIPPEDVNAGVIDKYTAENADIFDKDPEAMIGGWFNKADYTDENGRVFKRGVYLDVIMVAKTKKEAHDQCAKINDASYFDLKNFRTINLNSPEDREEEKGYRMTNDKMYEWHKWNLSRRGVSDEEIERMRREGLGPLAKQAEDEEKPPAPTKVQPSQFVHFLLPRGISSEEAAKAIQDMIKRQDDKSE